MKLITVICPVFNEVDTIPLFFEKMRAVMRTLRESYRIQLLFLNNSSTDGSLELIQDLMKKYDDVFCITLSVNVGYQRSVEYGIKNAVGDLFMIVDVDCEDPPEMLVDFLKEHQEGYDIVYGERVDREESALMKKIRKLFYRLTRAVSDEKFLVDMAEFCLFTEEVRDALIEDRSSFPFIRASIGRVGFRIKGIPYRRHRRIAGQTHYNLLRMTTFAIAGILSSSTLPLRLMAYFFPILIGLNMLFVIEYIAAQKLVRLNEALLMNSLYVAIGVAFMSIYLARTYKNGLGRPNAFMIKRFTKLQEPMK